jgi:hypothetical protein
VSSDSSLNRDRMRRGGETRRHVGRQLAISGSSGRRAREREKRPEIESGLLIALIGILDWKGKGKEAAGCSKGRCGARSGEQRKGKGREEGEGAPTRGVTVSAAAGKRKEGGTRAAAEVR